MTSIPAAILTFPLNQPVAIFLVVLMIILLAPLLFNRLKIPHVVGMIVSGMLIGPHCFNILARDASFEIFGQVGILYLMFLAAVEIDMFHLKQNSRAGVVFGLISFAIPMSVGIITAHWAFGVSWVSAALIASMYASHTLISYPVISRFGLSNLPSAVISICGTIVAVFLALVTLAMVVDIQTVGAFEWTGLIRLLVCVAVYVFVLGSLLPPAARWFFRNFNDTVTQFIFVLAMVFVASLLAQLIGLEAILGAFYAGLVLNRFIPSRSGLMGRIEFVGNAIFIPYFLIGVGMLINIHVITKGWGVIWTAANMIVVALVCKWIAAWIAQKCFRLGGVDRRIIFGLTSGKAAATIAATMVGYKYGLLSEDIMNGAVIMILACCIIASVTTERAAINKRMELTDEELKNENGPRRKNARQLVAVANPLTSEGLMRLAMLMRHPNNDLPVTTLFIRNNDDAASLSMGRNAMKAAREAAEAADIEIQEVERYDTNIVAGIINVMKERECTDCVIGFHRKSNIVDTFYGSMIEQLLRISNKMVTMSRCFMPANTMRRLMINVPAKAEYETGFRMWVERMGNLASQLGCRAVFGAARETIPYIQGVLQVEGYSIRTEFQQVNDWDDFIIFSSEVKDDDLLIIIGARRTSVSYNPSMEDVPAFLSKYMAGNNILLIYPEQFGASMEMPPTIDPLSQSIATGPGGLPAWLRRLRFSFWHR